MCQTLAAMKAQTATITIRHTILDRIILYQARVILDILRRPVNRILANIEFPWPTELAV